jgi:hypothetical protein
VGQNEKESNRYLKRAADLGNASAQYYFVAHLANGIGIEPNLSEATRYMKFSAEQGNRKAITFFERNATSIATGPPNDLSTVAFERPGLHFKRISADELREKRRPK